MNLDDRIEYLRNKGFKKRVHSHWYKKWWGILILITLAVVLVYILSFAFLAWRLATNPTEANLIRQTNVNETLINNNSSTSDQVSIDIIQGQNNYYLGSNNPQFTLVFFSDFNCSYCQKNSDVVGKLIIKYGDKIKIIIRDYPIISDNSVDLAMGARCAGEQGKYWPMYYKMFELQGDFSTDGLNTIAQTVGVNDLAKFSDCLLNKTYLNEIKKDYSDGQYLKLEGTPSWYINGTKVSSGYISFDSWVTLLDNILK